MKKLVLFGALFLTLWTANGQGKLEAIIDDAGSVAGSYAGTAGWTFQPLKEMTVTDLGCLTNVVALMGSVQIGLWDQNGVLLASNTITSADTLSHQTYYESITPVAILPSQTYHIGAYSGGLISLVIGGPGFGFMNSLSGDIQMGSAANTASGFAFPAVVADSAGVLLLAPNFRYTNIPEPSSLSLLAIPLLGFALRRFGAQR
jgi:hypothetical protein